jgi:hypothetical protein
MKPCDRLYPSTERRESAPELEGGKAWITTLALACAKPLVASLLLSYEDNTSVSLC